MQALVSRNRKQKDALTGLYSRSGLYHVAEAMLARAGRAHESLTSIYIHVDDFEAFKDQYGKIARNRLLNEVGMVLKRNTRKGDPVARLHSDQFIIFVIGTHSDSFALIHRLQDELNKTISGLGYPVNASIGAMTYSNCPESVKEIVAAAENAMSHLKSSAPSPTVH